MNLSCLLVPTLETGSAFLPFRDTSQVERLMSWACGLLFFIEETFDFTPQVWLWVLITTTHLHILIALTIVLDWSGSQFCYMLVLSLVGRYIEWGVWLKFWSWCWADVSPLYVFRVRLYQALAMSPASQFFHFLAKYCFHPLWDAQRIHPSRHSFVALVALYSYFWNVVLV